mgnify:CR=1 FL=1
MLGLVNGNVEFYQIESNSTPIKLWQKRLNVDISFSIQTTRFANVSNRFLIGNEHGLSIIFGYEKKTIKNKMVLNDDYIKYKIGVDLAEWSCDDNYLTIVYGYIIKVWSSTSGKLMHKLSVRF